VLQPDGMFLASMLGGDTLRELRNACHLAEEEREGGFSLRTSPLVHVRVVERRTLVQCRCSAISCG
jgi:NADH dehydrogenase [ubiquinone] 1 alpha subcomplex assembly factor 5